MPVDDGNSATGSVYFSSYNREFQLLHLELVPKSQAFKPV